MTKLQQMLLFYTTLAAPATSGLSVTNNSVALLDCTEFLRLKRPLRSLSPTINWFSFQLFVPDSDFNPAGGS